MKHAILIVVFALILKPLLPLFSYVANYNYIVKELCVNKQKPQLHCNGKCHLMKELAKASENEKPATGKKNLHQETELFLQANQSFTIAGFYKISTNTNQCVYNNLYAHSAVRFLFRPPSVIS